MDKRLKKLLEHSKINRKYYVINKVHLSQEEIDYIKTKLTFVPKTHANYQQFAKKLKIFKENKKNMFLPRFWGIENIGFPETVLYGKSENIDHNFVGILRDYQEPIVKKIIDKMEKEQGASLCVGTGYGKTSMSLYIASHFKKKTLIMVHTSILLEQWKERIKQFLPDAKVGVIQGKTFDIEDKDFVISMIQTLISKTKNFKDTQFKDFGMTIADECFPFDTGIITEDGYKLIGTLYEMWKNKKELPRVLSFNQDTKTFEYKRITYGWRKERQDMLRIKASKKIIKCTPEHKILTTNGYLEANKLSPGDLLMSYYNYNDNRKFDYISKAMNSDQEQLLLGSFLGDGCVRKINGENRIRLSIIHGRKQEKYCRWKASMFGINDVTYIEKNGYAKTPAYSFKTKVIDIEKKYIFPKNKYTCPQWILDKIDARGLTIWFLDDGSSSSNSSSLSTHSFDLDSQERIVRVLQEKFDLESRIAEDKRGVGYYITMKKESTIKLFNLISPYIRNECMSYKIHNTTYDYSYNWNNNFLSHGLARVDSITPYIHKGYGRQTKPYVYDIEVEDNHNFVICGIKDKCNINQGIIVSNCHHLSAPSFFKCIPTVSSKYMLGLTATPNREDNLQDIFKNFIGKIGFDGTKDKCRMEVKMKIIMYNNDKYREKRVWCRGDFKLDIHNMNDQILENEERNDFLIKLIKKTSLNPKRHILVLSTRINHLKTMKEKIDKILDENTTSSLYIGGMKKDELEVASKANILFASYQLVSEGTDIPTLNTLFLAFPKKNVAQVCGRILRKQTETMPLMYDFVDNFSIYKTQHFVRKRFYDSQGYFSSYYNYEDIIENDFEFISTESKKPVVVEDDDSSEECLF